MKKLLTLYFFCCLILCRSGAQAQKDIPETVRSWIAGELKKAKNQTLIKDYNSKNFFRKDSARIVGYLEGYNPSLGFSTGIIFASNELVREDYPTVVDIHPDGRFEATFPIWYPLSYFIDLKDRFIDFYIEPGQTLAIIIDWPKVAATHQGNSPYISYMGASGKINSDLNSLNIDARDYRQFLKDVKSLGPADFKFKYEKKWREADSTLQQQFKEKKTVPQARRIAKSKLDNEYGATFFDYVNRRDYEKTQDSTNAILHEPVPVAYYSFLNRLNLNDWALLTSNSFSSFVNRYEYSEPFNIAARFRVGGDTDLEKAINGDKITDSIVQNFYASKNSLVYEIAKLRKQPFLLKYAFLNDTGDQKSTYISQLKKTMSVDFFRKELDDVLAKAQLSKSSQGYKIPGNKAGSIFQNIIAPHKGKTLFVDFWATTCAPCVAGIKHNFDLRKKYENNPDFAFLFITSEDESPVKDYKKFVAEQQLTNTVILNINDYRYLRELFRFNGIPRYVIIGSEGNILNDNFLGSFQQEITTMFPKYQ